MRCQSSLLGTGKAILDFFTGGTGDKVVTVADEAFYSQQERAADDKEDLANARAMQTAPMNYAGQPPFVALVNVLVDAVSRAIRPGVTLWLIGGFSGLWELPQPDTIDPYWMAIFQLVITFWFSGRVILKDIPTMLAAFRKLRKA